MIYPTFSELTKDQFNRYQLALATAKCARIVTDEYVQQREDAEKAIAGGKESERPMQTMIDKELKDEKAVKIAINRIYNGEYSIIEDDTVQAEQAEADVEDSEADSENEEETSSETTEQE